MSSDEESLEREEEQDEYAALLARQACMPLSDRITAELSGAAPPDLRGFVKRRWSEIRKDPNPRHWAREFLRTACMRWRIVLALAQVCFMVALLYGASAAINLAAGIPNWPGLSKMALPAVVVGSVLLVVYRLGLQWALRKP
jgi:hypothetical protein